MRHRRPRPTTLLTLLLGLLPMAHALDRGGIVPALEAHFPASVAYLDCPYTQASRTCVLVPGATSSRSASAAVVTFLRTLPGVTAVERRNDPPRLSFQVDDTVYRVTLGASKARPGVTVATMTFAFDRASAFHSVCLKRGALFDYARQPTLTSADYDSMTTAITCHGADPTDARSRTPLVLAVQSRNLAAVRALLRAGADPNHITLAGWTPLLFAAKSGTRAILDALLQAGGDPSYIAPDGATVAALEPFNTHLAGATSAAPATVPVLPTPLAPIPTDDTLARAEDIAAVAQASDTTRLGEATPRQPPATAPAAPTAARPFPVLPLELLAMATLLGLVLLRVRRASPTANVRSPAVTATPTDLPAMPVPDPYQRNRALRHLDPRPSEDPLL